MPSHLPFKESSRELILEVARALEPDLPEITVAWRRKLEGEFPLDVRALSALERLNFSVGCSYLGAGDFTGFFENLNYYGTRLAKLEVDTRVVARSLELYQACCEPHLSRRFGHRRGEAVAALEMLSSATFVTVSGAYFDTKTHETASLLSVLDAELSAENLPRLLERVLGITCNTFAASLGVLLLRDDNSDLLRVHSSVGAGNEVRSEAVRIGQGLSGLIALTGEPMVTPDASHDPRVVSPTLRRMAKSVWGVPLRANAETMGVLLIGFPRVYEWLPTERNLMRAIADRTALAIDRARMTDALREREARIAELSGYLLSAQEKERKRISRELHDETGQALMVIRLYLGMLEGKVSSREARAKIRETLDVVDRTIEGIRRIIARLSPLVLQELGLVAAVRKEAKDLARATGVKARVAISDAVGRLSPEIEAALYRVVQEALHNVAKHAHATTVTVQMMRENARVCLLVEDDGVGIHTRSSSRGSTFGLAGIKERISTLGGEVRINSARGKGTRIEVTVPGLPAPAETRATAAS